MADQIAPLITFVAGTIARAAEVNSNFSDIRTAYNQLVTNLNEVTFDTIQSASASGVDVNDDFTVTGNLTVTGTAAITGNVTLSGDIQAVNVTATTSFIGPAFDGTASVTYTASFGTAAEAYDFRYEWGDADSGPVGLFYGRYSGATGPALKRPLVGYGYFEDNATGTTSHQVQGVAGFAELPTGWTTDTGTVTISGFAATAVSNVGASAHSDNVTIWGFNVVTSSQGTKVASQIGMRVVMVAAVGGISDVGGTSYTAYLGEPPDVDGAYAEGELATLFLEDPGHAGNAMTIWAESGAKLTPGGIWTDASSMARKRGIRGAMATPQDRNEILNALRGITPRRFERRVPGPRGPSAPGRPDEPGPRGEPTWKPDVGFVAEEVPDIVAQGDRTGIAPGRLSFLAISGWQINDERLDDLEARITALENA